MNAVRNNVRQTLTIVMNTAAVLLLATGSAQAQFGPYAPDANTRALYHFDGTARDDAGMLSDSSGNNFTFYANGVDPLGSSVNPSLLNAFDDVGGYGTLAQYVPTVTSGTDWTIEALLNIRDFLGAAPGERRDPIGFDSGTRLGFRPDGYFEMVVGGASQFSTASQVQLGVWFHIAMTYQASSGTVKIFKNGVDITGGAGAIPLNVGLGANLRIGHNAGNYDMWIDEFRISDTIRTFTPFDPSLPLPAPGPTGTLITLQ